MTVPEAAINKEGDAEAGQNQIRASRQFAVMQPETRTAGMEAAPDHDLGSGAGAPNSRHVPAARRWVMDISQTCELPPVRTAQALPRCAAAELICVSRCSCFSPSRRVVRGGDVRGGAGMVEIIFELRLIFPGRPAAANFPRD